VTDAHILTAVRFASLVVGYHTSSEFVGWGGSMVARRWDIWGRKAGKNVGQIPVRGAAGMPTRQNANHIFGPNVDQAKCRWAECRLQLLVFTSN